MGLVIPKILQQVDSGPVIFTSATTIAGNTGTEYIAVSSVSSPYVDCILVGSTIGQFINVYENTQTLLCVIPPGWNDYLGVSVRSGQSLRLRAADSASITSAGEITIQLCHRGG